MSEKLHFALVSPARELFASEVDHVVAPGIEGEFGVLANHAPFMTMLKDGIVKVLCQNEKDKNFFLRGGFADVTPDGLTILAEEAIDLSTVSATELKAEIQQIHTEVLSLSEEDGRRGALKEQVSYLEAVFDALNGGVMTGLEI